MPITDSSFHQQRRQYQPTIPDSLKDLSAIGMHSNDSKDNHAHHTQTDLEDFRALFPHSIKLPILKNGSQPSHHSKKIDTPFVIRAGVVLSGGPAPGGHNVIAGLYDALKELNPHNQLFGFLGGPSGILQESLKELTEEDINRHRNSGGFYLLGSGRTKLETTGHFKTCAETLQRHELNTLVVIGGDDSNTNAGMLAEYFYAQHIPIAVIGIPKTIDGDLKNTFVATSFGFDTAARVYADLIANIAQDTLSAKKYYHFIRLMGRSASHITLECALQTQPNITLIAEEVAEKKQTLKDIVADLANVVIARAEQGKNFGIVLIPEGIIEFIPEMQFLIQELNNLLAQHRTYIESLSGFTSKSEYINGKLSKDASYTFSSLPIDIQRQLLMERDPHGNVVVSSIETEKLLIEMLVLLLGEAKANGRFKGSFGYQRHFLGYEGRCAAPSNFDASYAYALGRQAAVLAQHRLNGYMAVVNRLTAPVSDWQAMAVPLQKLMAYETRKGRRVPVIEKGLVDLHGPAMQYFLNKRISWAEQDSYRIPGPIQYFGEEMVCDKVPATLALEDGTFDNGKW